MLLVIKRYSLQLVFTVSLLLGLQLPNFLQQYELRLQGHFSEAKLQLSEFQSLADTYFSGDLQMLIAKHKKSQVALFRDEANLIEQSYLRVQTLQQKVNYIDKPMWYRLGRLTQEMNQPLFQATWKTYQANIVLNESAITVGVSIAVLLMLLLELLFYCIKIFAMYCFKYNANHRH